MLAPTQKAAAPIVTRPRGRNWPEEVLDDMRDRVAQTINVPATSIAARDMPPPTPTPTPSLQASPALHHLLHVAAALSFIFSLIDLFNLFLLSCCQWCPACVGLSCAAIFIDFHMSRGDLFFFK
jgi:hypothetical protein